MGAIETVGIVEELMEIWSNEVCDRNQPLEEMTWEDHYNVIQEAPQACQDYHQKHPDAPKMPSVRIPGNVRGCSRIA